ncbi:hypothetical protein FGAF14_45440 [Escherichia coli]|nr:hypothetical protein FGAF14_45440 [Escherichia coli]
MMQQDWHPADIIAGLKKRGTSLAAQRINSLRLRTRCKYRQKSSGP